MIEVIACRFSATLLAILFVFSGTNSAKKLERMKATLVETYEWPQCVGLDCPPWPVLPFAVFCFHAGDTFYVAEYRPRPLPWATKGKKLMALVGSSLEIVLKGKKIVVVAHQLKLALIRVQRYGLFKIRACQEA